MIGFPFLPGNPTSSIPHLVTVAMAGGEMDASTHSTPVSGTNYLFPSSADMNYIAGKGANGVTVTFSWEPLQPTIGGAFNSTYQTNLVNCVMAALNHGMYCIVRMQQYWGAAPLSNGGGVYAGRDGYVIGATNGATAAQFAAFWVQLATLFKSYPRVIFDLINEPNQYFTPGQTNALWFTAAQAAITAIRAAGISNTIFVEGNAFSAGVSWNSTTTYGSTANTTSFTSLTDPYNNIYPCIHNYTDGSSGNGGFNTDISDENSSSVADNTVYGENLTKNLGAGTSGVLSWAITNNKKIFIGEMGISASPSLGNATTAIASILSTHQTNKNNMLGLGWWVMGSSFYQNAGQPYALYPNSGYSPDTPQMALFTTLLPIKSS